MDEHIALRVDWDRVDGSIVTDVRGENPLTLTDGSGSWDAVAICIGDRVLSITVEPDTDQIIVELGNLPRDAEWTAIPSLAFAIGKPLGWCWVGINCQGYKDSFTLAFGDIVPDALQPRCTFLAEASSLSCFDLVPHRA